MMQNHLTVLYISLCMLTSTFKIISSSSYEQSDGDTFPKCGYSQVPIVKGNSLKKEDYEKESYLIIGGQTARRGSWPWAVYLEEPQKVFCGGSVITKDWILTAAHCIQPYANKLNEVTVVLGAHVRSEVSFERIKMKLKRGLMHPQYERASLENDIGLMELEQPILFHPDKAILPVCLPEPDEDLKPGTMTYVMGWGVVVVPSAYASDILKQAMVPVIENDRCDEIIRSQITSMGTLQNNTFCTHYDDVGGHNTCVGDSGSSLVVERDNLWVQYGVVSWGMVDCAEKGSPSVFTKVSAFIPWIKNITGTNNAKIR